MTVKDQIQVSRAEMEQAAATFAVMFRGRELGAAGPSLGQALSCSPRDPRAFMTPRAAKLFGPEQGRQFLGGLAYRDAPQLFAQPTIGDVHVDSVLTDISVRYRNLEYIAATAVPRVQVVNRSDKYFIFDTANLRNDALTRAPGAASRRGGYNLSTGNYSVETYSYETQVPDEIRRNADNPLNPDRNGVEFVSDIIDLKMEKAAATLINTSGNWTTNATLSGTSQWSDYANSDPFTDLKTARETVITQIARRANTLILGYQVFEVLALHPDLLDRCKYGGTGDRPAMVTAQMMAQLFMVDQVLVGSAIENTAVEGQTDTLAFVWGKHAWMGYVAPQAALETPSAAYCFTVGREVDTYRDDNIKSDIIRAEEEWDMKKVAAGAGYRVINAVA